jgi:hypothetical protein
MIVQPLLLLVVLTVVPLLDLVLLLAVTCRNSLALVSVLFHLLSLGVLIGKKLVGGATAPAVTAGGRGFEVAGE